MIGRIYLLGEEGMQYYGRLYPTRGCKIRNLPGLRGGGNSDILPDESQIRGETPIKEDKEVYWVNGYYTPFPLFRFVNFDWPRMKYIP